MCKQQGNDKDWKAFISPLASLRRISNFLIIRWIIDSGSRRLKEFGVIDVSGEPLSFTVSRIIHTDMKRINMYVRFHWTQYATNGRLPITPSWLFNVSLARANILEKFVSRYHAPCCIISGVSYHTSCSAFVHYVWIIFTRRNC